MKSPIWYRESARETTTFPQFSGPAEARVAIIGGGYAGTCLALGLAERGITDVTLLEAETIGYGASGRNGGFVFGGYSLDEVALLDRLGADHAKRLYRASIDAVELIRRRIKRHAIDCDLVEAGVIWANWFADPAILRRRQRLLADHFDAHWQWMPREQVQALIHTDAYHDALYEAGAFHVHPLDYVRGLARVAVESGVAIHEHSRVIALERDGAGWIMTTAGGSLRAETVVLACGGYLAHLDKRVDKAVLPIATYVMATEPLGERLSDCLETRAAIYDTRFAFDYYHATGDDRILWGGRISVRDRSPETVKRLLYRDLLRVFPQLEGVHVDYAWSGLMSYARHQMPQVGTRGDGLWWMQAFGGHGTAPTCAVAEMVADALAGGNDRWRDFERFGLDSAWRPAGYLAAQGSYWWMQARDGWQARRG